MDVFVWFLKVSTVSLNLLCANRQIGYIFSGNLAEIFLIYICISINHISKAGLDIRYSLHRTHFGQTRAHQRHWVDHITETAVLNERKALYLSICFQNHSSLYLRSQLHVTTLCELQLGL